MNRLEDMKDVEDGEAKVKNSDEESYLGDILSSKQKNQANIISRKGKDVVL